MKKQIGNTFLVIFIIVLILGVIISFANPNRGVRGPGMTDQNIGDTRTESQKRIDKNLDNIEMQMRDYERSQGWTDLANQ